MSENFEAISTLGMWVIACAVAWVLMIISTIVKDIGAARRIRAMNARLAKQEAVITSLQRRLSEYERDQHIRDHYERECL